MLCRQIIEFALLIHTFNIPAKTLITKQTYRLESSNINFKFKYLKRLTAKNSTNVYRKPFNPLTLFQFRPDEYCMYKEGEDYLNITFPGAAEEIGENFAILTGYGGILVVLCHIVYSLIRVPRLR